jgi:glycosyltransferase involved in cell wall biosynthesis
MASSLPVVAFDVGGVRDILGPLQQDFICAPRDVACFVDRAAMLLDDESTREALAKENAWRVDRYATDAVVSMFVARVVAAKI